MTSFAEPHSAAALRVTHDPGRTEIFAALSCLFVCLAFLALVHVTAGDAGGSGANPELPLLLSGFAIGAAGCAAWAVRAGLVRANRKRVYRLAGKEVVCANGRKILWREPVGAFQRIGWREQRRQTGGRYGGYYTAQVLTLEHEQPLKSFEIAAHDDIDQTLRISKQWALALGLPVLRENADGGLTRAATALDMPLAGLAEQGGSPPEFDATAPPPGSITWRQAGSDTRIETRITWAVTLPAPLLLLAAVDPFLAARSGNTTAALVAFGLALAAVLLVLAPILIRQLLCIDATRALGELRCAGMVLRRRSLPLAAITRVYNTSAFPDGIVLEGRETRIRITLLSAEAATWMDACVRHLIATRSAPY